MSHVFGDYEMYLLCCDNYFQQQLHVLLKHLLIPRFKKSGLTFLMNDSKDILSVCDKAYSQRFQVVKKLFKYYDDEGKSLHELAEDLENTAIATEVFPRRSFSISRTWLLKRTKPGAETPIWLCQAALCLLFKHKYIPENEVEWYWFTWLWSINKGPFENKEQAMDSYGADYLKHCCNEDLLKAFEYYFKVAKLKGFKN